MGRSVLTIAAGVSSRSINALLVVTLKVTSPTGSSIVEGGLGTTVSSSSLSVGYCSDTSTGTVSVL